MSSITTYRGLTLCTRRLLTVTLCLFVAVSWMPRVTTVGDTDIGIGAMLLALMVPLMLLSPPRSRLDPEARTRRATILASLGFVLLWGYLGVYLLDEPFRAGRLFLSFGQGVVLILVVTEYLSPKAIRVALAISALLIVGVSALSLYNYVGGRPLALTYLQPDRSSGLFKNPNQYGMIAAMAVPFAVAQFFQHGRKLLATLVLVAAFISLMTAASKTNLVLAIVFAVVAMGYGLLVRGRIVALLVAVPVTLLLIGATGLPVLKFFNPRAASIIEQKVLAGNLEESTLNDRFELWGHSLAVMAESPLFGEGTGQPIRVAAQTHTHSHNVFLDLGRTVGIPGMFGALVFLFTTCRLAIGTLIRIASLPPGFAPRMHGRAHITGASLAILSYAVSNQMSDSMGPSTSVFLWLCVGLVLRRDEMLFLDGSKGVEGRGPESGEAPSRRTVGAGA